jgi:hypothetical protein
MMKSEIGSLGMAKNAFMCTHCKFKFRISKQRYKSYVDSVKKGYSSEYIPDYPTCPNSKCKGLSDRHIVHYYPDDWFEDLSALPLDDDVRMGLS